jgi:hypothetical protein
MIEYEVIVVTKIKDERLITEVVVEGENLEYADFVEVAYDVAAENQGRLEAFSVYTDKKYLLYQNNFLN